MDNAGLMDHRNSLLNIANDLLKEGKQLMIEARGYSMYPTIKPGETVYIKACNIEEDVAPGNIIAWKNGNDIILHRVVSIYGSDHNTFFITRGDGSLNNDSPIKFNQIVGKAIRIDSGGKSRTPDSEAIIPGWKYRYNKRRVWMILKFAKLIKMLKNE